jgi:hypothetical protein
MARLNYSSDRELRDEPTQKMKTLVDDLVAVHQADGPIAVDIGQVRPLGGGWLVSVSLSAEAPLDQLVSLEESIARAAVDVGLEPDIPTATESVTIS